ncbi:MAG TPA: hypothetical protein VH877_32270 [Polyangia bacterium]|nr:hypothetical protein [Polyangia bacterium]
MDKKTPPSVSGALLPPAAPASLPVLKPHTLDALAVGIGPALAPADEKLLATLLRRVREVTLVASGQRVDTRDILESVPGLVVSSRSIYSQLTQQQQRLCVGYSERLDTLLLHEALKLRDLKREYDLQSRLGAASRAVRRMAAREALQEGTALRNQAVTALRSVLGDDDASLIEVQESKGAAETAEQVADSLECLADLVEEQLQEDEDTAALMEELRLTADYAVEIRHAADWVREAVRADEISIPVVPVSQRRVDLQDGIVLHLISMIVRAFRAAQGRDHTIAQPALGALSPVFCASTPLTSARSEAQPGDPGDSGGSVDRLIEEFN